MVSVILFYIIKSFRRWKGGTHDIDTTWNDITSPPLIQSEGTTLVLNLFEETYKYISSS